MPAQRGQEGCLKPHSSRQSVKRRPGRGNTETFPFESSRSLVGISCLWAPQPGCSQLPGQAWVPVGGRPRPTPTPRALRLCPLLLGVAPPRSPAGVSRDTQGYLGLWAVLTSEPTRGPWDRVASLSPLSVGRLLPCQWLWGCGPRAAAAPGHLPRARPRLHARGSRGPGCPPGHLPVPACAVFL